MGPLAIAKCGWHRLPFLAPRRSGAEKRPTGIVVSCTSLLLPIRLCEGMDHRGRGGPEALTRSSPRDATVPRSLFVALAGNSGSLSVGRSNLWTCCSTTAFSRRWSRSTYKSARLNTERPGKIAFYPNPHKSCRVA